MSLTNSIAKDKYLSTLVDRFTSRYMQEDTPQLTQFITEWLEHAEESYIDDNGDVKLGFWRTLSKLQDFIDVDAVPNEVLLYFMEHYANNFNKSIENIPYFVEWVTTNGVRERYRDPVYGKIVYKYNNIRAFLKTCRKFFNAKGSYYSYFYLFRMFEGSCKIIPVNKDIMKSSDRYTVLSAPNPNNGRLSHAHGIYVDDERDYDWWYSYYAYIIETDLDEDFFKPLVLELVHPAGTYLIWKKQEVIETKTGWGYDQWGSLTSGSFGSMFNNQYNAAVFTENDEITYQMNTVGVDSPYREISIRNNGMIPLTITAITLDDDVNYNIDLSIGTNPITSLPITLNFYQSATLGLKFTPTIPGEIRTTLSIVSNDLVNNPYNIEIVGYGV